MKNLIEKYLSRNSKELERIKETMKTKLHASKSNKDEFLLAQTEKESAEYETGFELPDLSSGSNLSNLRNWNGHYHGVASIKMIRIKR